MRHEHPDPAFPRPHGRPDRGWVNDPNGCSYVDGCYHVFFQHNPERPVHEAIKWGHVSSTDLVHWQPEPIALVNRPGALDAYGCWSGCVVDDASVPIAVYSGVVDDGGRSQVLLARSDRRMQTWVAEQSSVTACRTTRRSPTSATPSCLSWLVIVTPCRAPATATANRNCWCTAATTCGPGSRWVRC